MNVEGMDGMETDAMEPTENAENTTTEPSGENYMENTNEDGKKEKKNQA